MPSWCGPEGRGGKWPRKTQRCTTLRSARGLAQSGSCSPTPRSVPTSTKPRGCALSTWRNTRTTNTDPGVNPRGSWRGTASFSRCPLSSGTPRSTLRDFLWTPFSSRGIKQEPSSRRPPLLPPSPCWSRWRSSAPELSSAWRRCRTPWPRARCRLARTRLDIKLGRLRVAWLALDSTPIATPPPPVRATWFRVTAAPGRPVYSHRSPIFCSPEGWRAAGTPILRPPKAFNRRRFIYKTEYGLYDLMSPGKIGILLCISRWNYENRVMCSLLNCFYERCDSGWNWSLWFVKRKGTLKKSLYSCVLLYLKWDSAQLRHKCRHLTHCIRLLRITDTERNKKTPLIGWLCRLNRVPLFQMVLIIINRTNFKNRFI